MKKGSIKLVSNPNLEFLVKKVDSNKHHNKSYIHIEHEIKSKFLNEVNLINRITPMQNEIDNISQTTQFDEIK